MKKLLKNSLLISAAILGIGSVGAGGIVAKAATTTAPPETSTSTADLTPGTITLDSVPGGSTSTTTPGGIDFGTVASSASDATYKSTSISSDLHVTNPGEPTGWSVSVADSAFSNATGGSLKGAVLSLADSKSPALTADASDNVSTLPTFSPTLSLSTAPVTVVDAAAGDGIGAYTATYNPTDASLTSSWKNTILSFNNLLYIS